MKTKANKANNNNNNGGKKKHFCHSAFCISSE
jgi:hypothetical protein